MEIKHFFHESLENTNVERSSHMASSSVKSTEPWFNHNLSCTEAAVYINVTCLCCKCLQMMPFTELNGEVCPRKTATLGGRNGALHPAHHTPGAVSVQHKSSLIWSERPSVSSHAYMVILLFLFFWGLLSDPVLNAPKQQQVPLWACMTATILFTTDCNKTA